MDLPLSLESLPSASPSLPLLVGWAQTGVRGAWLACSKQLGMSWLTPCRWPPVWALGVGKERRQGEGSLHSLPYTATPPMTLQRPAPPEQPGPRLPVGCVVGLLGTQLMGCKLISRE